MASRSLAAGQASRTRAGRASIGTMAESPEPARALRIVVVGAGFAGLAATRALARAPVEVTLIDRSNHHLFQPLLYQVATAGLSGPQIAAPTRWILRRQRNCTVLLAEVTGIDPAARTLRLADRTLPWDALLLACGATHAYFGHEDWAVHAPGLKTLDDALAIRRRVLIAFERAELAMDEAARAAQLTFVVIGGGPTGVEVLTGSPVTGIDADGVRLGARRIDAATVLWAAGVAGSALARDLGVPLDRVGRVPVETTLQVPGVPRIWVAGDLAAVTDVTGRRVPGVAPAAQQAGRVAARNMLAALEAQAQQPLRWRDRGSMATIGRRRAIADFGRLRLWGAPAWWAWLLVHILFLIGFRNRLVVLVDWAWSYVTFARGARLIVGRDDRSP